MSATWYVFVWIVVDRAAGLERLSREALSFLPYTRLINSPLAPVAIPMGSAHVHPPNIVSRLRCIPFGTYGPEFVESGKSANDLLDRS